VIKLLPLFVDLKQSSTRRCKNATSVTIKSNWDETIMCARSVTSLLMWRVPKVYLKFAGCLSSWPITTSRI